MSEIDLNSAEFLADSEPAHFRPWRELAVISEMCMELSWLALWYVFITQTRLSVSYGQVVLVLGTILFGSYLLARMIRRIQIRLSFRRALMAAVLILFVIFGMKILLYSYQPVSLGVLLSRPLRTFRDMANLIPEEFIVITFVLYLCWRGISRVDRHISAQEVISAFKTGVVIFLLYGVVARLGKGFSGFELYFFLFSSLLAMTAARISVSSSLRGGQSIAFDRRWLAGVGLVILGVVAISALLISLARGQLMVFLMGALSWTLYIIALILSPLLFLVMRILILIGQWLNLSEVILTMTRVLSQLQMLIASLVSKLKGWLNGVDNQFLARLIIPLSWAKAFVLLGSVLLIILALTLMVRDRKIRAQAEAGGEIQTISGQENWLDLLLAALRRNLGKVAEGLEQALGLRRARRALAAARIRRIYAHLMDLSSDLGHPRPVSRTPLEFQSELESLFSGLKAELTMITAAYLKVRYGDLPEMRDEIETVELAWRQVSNSGKEMLKTTRAK